MAADQWSDVEIPDAAGMKPDGQTRHEAVSGVMVHTPDPRKSYMNGDEVVVAHSEGENVHGVDLGQRKVVIIPPLPDGSAGEPIEIDMSKITPEMSEKIRGSRGVDAYQQLHDMQQSAPQRPSNYQERPAMPEVPSTMGPPVAGTTAEDRINGLERGLSGLSRGLQDLMTNLPRMLSSVAGRPVPTPEPPAAIPWEQQATNVTGPGDRTTGDAPPWPTTPTAVPYQYQPGAPTIVPTVPAGWEVPPPPFVPVDMPPIQHAPPTVLPLTFPPQGQPAPANYAAIGMPFLGVDRAFPPTFDVIFTIPSLGTMRSQYHYASIRGFCLSLIYDTRDARQQYVPGEPGKTTKMRVQIPALEFAADVTVFDLHSRLGCLEIINMVVDPPESAGA